MKTTLDYTNKIRAQKVQDILSGHFLEKYPQIMNFNVYFFYSTQRGGYDVNVLMDVDYYDYSELDNRRRYRLIRKDVSNFMVYILGEREFINSIDFNLIKTE